MKKILLLLVVSHFCTSFLIAKSWHFESIHIKATVLPDGSMHVNEARSYDFRGKFRWADYSLSGLENQKILNFKLRDELNSYAENDSEESGTYFIEKAGNQFYTKWHYQARNEVKTFYLDYTITNVIKTYNDVAELYWKFVGENNPGWADSVSIEISMPEDVSFSEVKAWAHGPLWGNIKFVHKKVLLTIAKLKEKQYVEARIIFPPQWVSGSTVIGGSMEKKIQTEEKEFAEQANRERQRAIIEEQEKIEKNKQAYDMALPLGIFVIIIFIYLFWKFGRGFETTYTQKMDTNIPRDKHPALLNCVYFNNNVTGSTLSTALFYLAQKGILTIENDENTPKKWYDSGDPIIINLQRETWQKQKSGLLDFEDNLLEFLFSTVSNGAEQVTSKQMKKASSKMQKWFRKWQKLIKVHLKESPYFERESIKGSIINASVSIVVLVLAIIILVSYGKNGLWAFIPAIISSFLSLTILRFTPETKLLKKKLTALRKYLKTFGTSSYEASTSHKINNYFLFAIALGIGKKSTENILKNVAVDEQLILFPWFVHGGSAGPADFASAINSVVSAAGTSVSSAAGAGGGMSGAGGAGGGGAAGGAG